MPDDLVFYLYENRATPGVWCGVCLRPSGVVISADMLGDDGVLPDAIRMAKCQDCGARLEVPFSEGHFGFGGGS